MNHMFFFSFNSITEYTCLQAGITAVHPQVDPTRWPAPYGNHLTKDQVINQTT